MMNVDEIKSVIKTRYDHNMAKQAMKEKYHSKLIITSQSGCWQITPQFISFLNNQELGEHVVILDYYGNPVKVDRNSLLTECINQYNMVMNEWLDEHNQIRKQR